MDPPSTVELLDTLDVVDDDVAAVVEAYLSNPTVGPVAFGEGYRIDPASAVAAHPFARTMLKQPWATLELRRAVVRTAVLMAKPERDPEVAALRRANEASRGRVAGDRRSPRRAPPTALPSHFPRWTEEQLHNIKDAAATDERT